MRVSEPGFFYVPRFPILILSGRCNPEQGAYHHTTGIDMTHNPEFYACEFYLAYANLDSLMQLTKRLLGYIHNSLRTATKDREPPVKLDLDRPFPALDFIPALEAAMCRTLPDLESPSATEDLAKLCKDLGVGVPQPPTLPHMLDKLAAKFLEPHCQEPTFIVGHPESMSPLAKSFTHPENGRRVSARAELYIGGKEIANMYEEENSPVAQREKFRQQREYRRQEQRRPAEGENVDGESAGEESYLRALEWGLPPTGGWGLGIERLCMAMTGAERIADVLSFGTLKNVVALGASLQKGQVGSR